ncbi:MAG: hypothetical protein WA706_09785, partial [Pseudolabrys sp.]
EPATRAESADAEAAGGCGSFNIETTPIDVNEAADIERAVSALCSGGVLLPVQTARVEQKSFAK